MRAVQFSRFGAPDVLEIIDVPKPEPGQGEVLVRVAAAGINFFEVLMRNDAYAVTPELPRIPGVEVAGIVEAVGRDADAGLVGVRVAVPLFAASRDSGGWAEYVAVPAAAVVPLPDRVSFEAATALLVQGLTALHLVRLSAPAGRSVFVAAAAGGIGTLLMQLSKQAGAGLVIGGVGSAAKAGVARQYGADIVIDYSAAGWTEEVKRATEGDGVGIVYDLIGGGQTRTCIDALAPGGELVFGALGRFELTADEIEAMLLRNQSLTGFALLPALAKADVKADIGELLELAASGALQVAAGERYRLEDAADAHRAIESRRTTGKVVLVP